jgi:hypothetical protein
MKFHDQRSDKGWPDSADGLLAWLDHHQSILESSQQGTKISTAYPKDILNTAFTTLEGHETACRGNEAAVHQVALDENFVFTIYDDTPPEVIHHMLQVSHQSGRKSVKVSPCDWRESQ